MSDAAEPTAAPRRRTDHSEVFAEGYLAVVSPDSLAEACFAVPAVRALRNQRPQCTIIVLSTEEAAPLWDTVDEVDQVFAFPRNAAARKIVALLKKAELKFDAALAWEPSNAITALLRLEVPHRFGPKDVGLEKHLTVQVDPTEDPGPIKHRVRFYVRTVEKLGIHGFLPINFRPPSRPDQPERPRALIVPGSDFGVSAEWSIDNWATLSQAIIDNGSHELYVVASPTRSEPAHELAGMLTGSFRIFDEDLEETMELLATSEVLLGVDGSLPHLAAHVDTQTITIFGPNEPQWKRPLGKKHKIIREQVPCSPCLLSQCPLDHRCMDQVSIQDVLDALNDCRL